MKQTHIHKRLVNRFRRQWTITILISMIGLAGVHNLSIFAAPLAQTVPPPTPTAEYTPVATATPVPSDNNDDDDNNQEQPTATQPPPPTATATPIGLTARVNVAVLNVRGGPGTTFPVLGNVKINEELRVLERNEFGDWWRICCTSNAAPVEGWVLAQFVQANFDVGQLMTLVPLAATIPVAPTPTPLPPPEAVPTPAAVVLALEVQQDPPYAWQGQPLTLQFTLKNNGTDTAQNLEIRDELPLELIYLGGEAVGGELITAKNELSRTIVTATWPELTAGSNVTVVLNVQVTTTVPNGVVFTNLAVASAQNAQPVTGGISIGMPPTTLPDFR